MNDQIISYIKELKHLKDLSDEQRLIDPMSGFLDSLEIAELVSWLESTFHIRFDQNDLTDENLATVRSISALISRKISVSNNN